MEWPIARHLKNVHAAAVSVLAPSLHLSHYRYHARFSQFPLANCLYALINKIKSYF